jgi:long-chain acyl-CoA synthetase
VEQVPQMKNNLFEQYFKNALRHRKELSLKKSNIRGVTYDVIDSDIKNLRDLFKHAASNGEKDCIVFDKTRMSFSEFFNHSETFSQFLQQKYDINPKDRVGIVMQNRVEWLISFTAIVSIGAVAVPFNSWWYEDEILFTMGDANVKLLIGDTARLSRVSSALLSKIDVDKVDVFAWLRRIDESPFNYAFTPPIIDEDDDFCILYTSGSTGRPKGVALTHRGVLTAIHSWSLLADIMRMRYDGLEIYGKSPAILMSVPLFHVAGLHSCFLNSLFLGRKIVMTSKWDVVKAAQLILEERITSMVIVPTMTQDLVEYLEDQSLTCPSVVDVNSGGAKLQASAIKRIQSVFPNASPSSGYAMTETNALGAVNFGPDYIQRPESTGKPLEPITKVVIKDASGNVLPSNKEGEIWIKSAALFRT